jgi:hypothetical protein
MINREAFPNIYYNVFHSVSYYYLWAEMLYRYPQFRNKGAGCWWLTPVILATQEAEIRGITVWSQPGQIVHETQSQKTHHKKGLVDWLKV